MQSKPNVADRTPAINVLLPLWDCCRCSAAPDNLGIARERPDVAKTVYADPDQGIDNSLGVDLISGGSTTGSTRSAKNGVVTLTGTVSTARQRTQLEAIAQGVPNAEQVVNEIRTRHQKATSSR